MAVKWTEEQQRVIDTRGCSILVSAAAGSGKTAVLVARILNMITGENPIDIDRLLVVTFTNAAAAEMRERIRDALEQRAEDEPENEHLQRQLVLVHNAKITTIHSFCLGVLRSHFQTIGIDPAFRVADEGEMLLLEQDTARETVDDAYEDADEEFHQFLEQFTAGKSDQAIEAAVLQLYHFALGQPWPLEWLRECRAQYEGERRTGISEETDAPWLAYILEDTARLLTDLHTQVEEAIRIAQEPGGPYPYLGALESDLELLEGLEACGTDGYEGYARAFAQMEPFARLSAKRDDSIDPGKKQQVQAMRGDVKEALAALRKRYYYGTPEALWQELERSGLWVRVLTRLAEDFMERLAQKKAAQNLADFGDLEHFALQILVEKKDGQAVPTAAAREYAESFAEIMIDEYQDSNLVQELILDSVSGKGCGAQNRFMVGDVKQSIYRFRLARPELFMEKYKTYQADLPPSRKSEAPAGRQGSAAQLDYEPEDCGKMARQPESAAQSGSEPKICGKMTGGQGSSGQAATGLEACGESAGQPALGCRIDLHRNFRSRAQVLGGVNYIFRQIMTEHLGEIRYDEDAALYPGAQFAKGADESFLASELLLLEAESGQRQRAEAALVGRRIREMVGTATVWDKEEERYRPVRWGDIVILLRTVSGWAETFGEVLADMGIPCVTGSQKGYFSTVEIRTVLAYLQILDNPVQDIPLAAVLRSAIGGFSDEELAILRVFSHKKYFYDCCQEYRASGENPRLREKLERFFATFGHFRGKCAHTPVHLLLWEILDVTGYGAYAESLPAGRQRKANLDMLVEKAIAYEATSFRGLYHFVRYIENLKKYKVDYGEANVESEAADVVRIMSIHKSKGLEFPIVFVSGLGKQFNETDVRSRLVMHPEFGIGCDFVDAERRTRRATLLKRAIQQKTAGENLGEELRVLYVAMTRAKEKLILTGSVSDIEAKLERWRTAAMYRGEQLSYAWLSSASTYLDWVMPALLRHPASAGLFEAAGGEAECQRAEQRESQGAGQSEGQGAGQSEGQGAGQSEGQGAGQSEGQGAEQSEGHGSGQWEGQRGNAAEQSKEGGTHGSFSVEAAPFCMRIATVQEEEEGQRVEDSAATLQLRELLELDTSVCYDRETRDYLQRVFHSEYPYKANAAIPGKLSVSELKKLSHLPEEEDAAELYREETVIPLIPDFRKEKEPVTGAARGTVYHAFMENLNYLRLPEPDIRREAGRDQAAGSGKDTLHLPEPDIRREAGRDQAAGDGKDTLHLPEPDIRREAGRDQAAGRDMDALRISELEIQLEEMISCGKMSGEEAAALSLEDVSTFLKSGIGQRMHRAALAGQLFREQPFVFGVPASEIRSSYSPEETVLVQGIIDAYFFEGEEIVLLDYKTDRVERAQLLVDKYKAQLDYYARALEKLTGRPVKERIIYSFHCHEEISL